MVRMLQNSDISLIPRRRCYEAPRGNLKHAVLKDGDQELPLVISRMARETYPQRARRFHVATSSPYRYAKQMEPQFQDATIWGVQLAFSTHRQTLCSDPLAESLLGESIIRIEMIEVVGNSALTLRSGVRQGSTLLDCDLLLRMAVLVCCSRSSKTVPPRIYILGFSN